MTTTSKPATHPAAYSAFTFYPTHLFPHAWHLLAFYPPTWSFIHRLPPPKFCFLDLYILLHVKLFCLRECLCTMSVPET